MWDIGSGARRSHSRQGVPHDFESGDWANQKSRRATALSLGLRHIRVLKRIAIDQGIHAARLLLPRCYFDERQTRDLIAALSSYRREWDEDRKVFSVKPAHEWSSDGAASFRYLALGLREPRDGWADCPASTTATSSPRIA